MNIANLLQKPLWQMTGEEFIYLSKSAGHDNETESKVITTIDASSSKYVYGLSGIASLFGCSIPTANRKIDRAIKQLGRKIIVDAELALELAGKKTGGRK